MSRRFAGLWGVTLVTLLILGGVLFAKGTPVRADLFALLPIADQDPLALSARQRLAELGERKITLAFGHPDRDRAVAAAKIATKALASSKLITPEALEDQGEKLQALIRGKTSGLLSEADRQWLQEGKAEALAERAIGQIFGGLIAPDRNWLEQDPFLTGFAYLAEQGARSQGNLSLHDGISIAEKDGIYWGVITADLTDDPYSLRVQESAEALLQALLAQVPSEIKVLRTGTVFYAAAGAGLALNETAMIGGISIAGIIVLMVLAFRSIGPLLLNLLAIVIGIIVASIGTLMLDGELHVLTLLMGTSLIGVSVDYGLHYCAERFTNEAAPTERLNRILPGLLLGFATTTIGYGLLIASGLPALVQLAWFTVLGLGAAFLTVILWFPLLDRAPARALPSLLQKMTACADALLERRRLIPLLAIWVVIAGYGWTQLHLGDQPQKLQSPDATLLAEQLQLENITASGYRGQMILIQAKDDQVALEKQEQLATGLNALVADGGLSGWIAPATWVPSLNQQQRNWQLVREKLIEPQLQAHQRTLGMTDAPPVRGDFLTLEDTMSHPLVKHLVLSPGAHVIALQGLRDRDAISALMQEHAGIRFLDPPSDIAKTLKAYRHQGLVLLVSAMALVTVILIWRYGLSGGLLVMAPTALSILAAPGLAALSGAPFTFFSALGLILVLSVGIDYGIFLRETKPHHRQVTQSAVLLASCTTLLSFGLLAFSAVPAVQSFGAIMLAGVLTAVVFAPIAAIWRP